MKSSRFRDLSALGEARRDDWRQIGKYFLTLLGIMTAMGVAGFFIVSLLYTYVL
jgi:hypothetical protein